MECVLNDKEKPMECKITMNKLDTSMETHKPEPEPTE